MKKIRILIASFLVLGVTFLIPSCNPETGALGELPDKSEIQFDITQDFTADPGGNTVIMTNQTPGVTLTWDYGTGRSNKKVETVKYAFKGDYTINITAVTKGGIVNLDPVTITVTDDNLSYVDDPLWNLLSGGVGSSKTWITDDGNYGLALGPLAYADPSVEQEFENYTPNWEPDGNPPESTDENVGYGSTMTFSLDGGPFMITKKLNEGGIEENGTYFLDAEAKTLTTSDATILRPDNYIANVSNWNNNLKILELTENQLRIAVLRTNDEGPWLYILNYVSKEYADNYVPEDLPDPDPPINLNGGTVDDLLSTNVTTTKTWHLSADTPFDWTDLNGNLLNGWQTVEDYEAAGWPGYTSADQASVVENKITFSNDGTVTTIDSNGVEMSGMYTSSTDGTNIITFTDITPKFPIGSSWATVETTSQNQWKIVKTAVTGGTVTDIWFGKRDETGKDEYMVFHFVLDNGEVDPIEENRKLIIASLTGGSSRTFKVSDTWHVDWLAGDLSGGWTDSTTFADDFTSNSWVWTAAVKAGLQDPTLTFTKDGSTVMATKVQDGITTSAEVIIDAENNTIDIDMDLIAFTDSASWLPTYGATWYFCKSPLSAVETDGLWLGKLGVNGSGDPEVTAIHYVISQ